MPFSSRAVAFPIGEVPDAEAIQRLWSESTGIDTTDPPSPLSAKERNMPWFSHLFGGTRHLWLTATASTKAHRRAQVTPSHTQDNDRENIPHGKRTDCKECMGGGVPKGRLFRVVHLAAASSCAYTWNCNLLQGQMCRQMYSQNDHNCFCLLEQTPLGFH